MSDSPNKIPLKGPWIIINRLTKKDIQSCSIKGKAMKLVIGMNAMEKSNNRPEVFAVVPRAK